jgi:glycerol kinase
MHIIAIDQGTTSTRTVIFDSHANPIATAQLELPQHYPQSGWVEHDPEDIWRDTLATVRSAIASAGLMPADIAAIGMTNQRETSVIWDRQTGKPLHNAIVWQDRRGEPMCEALRAAGHEPMIQQRTGLLLDPYFSATKFAWLLKNVPQAGELARAGRLALGTVDSFLLWRLTGGQVHATDATNASRTMLFDIHRQCWCPDLCALFGIPIDTLPQVRDSAGLFGRTSPELFGLPLPIAGIAGDQQAALVGQGCFEPGHAKATYGTGCFTLVNTGTRALQSGSRLLTTVAYRLNGKPVYALEGSIFVAGAAIKWLRDGLGIITHASQTHDMATAVDCNGGIYLVPAFVGLGAPHWRADVRALITGMTLGTSAAHVARAALESIAYQTHDLLAAMQMDGAALTRLKIDGGMAANDWFCSFLASVLQKEVVRPAMLESTARGAALLAGHGIGLWPDMAAAGTSGDQTRHFRSTMGDDERQHLLQGWQSALQQALMHPADHQ